MTSSNTNYCHAVFPAPELDEAAPCGVCGGHGVTNERVSTEWSPDPLTGRARLLLAAVFCPACGGCGRSGHVGCTLAARGYPSGVLDELGDVPAEGVRRVWEELGADPAEEDPSRCPACDGRQWVPIQAFRDDLPQPVRIFARMPCGCARDLVQPVPAEDLE